MYAHRSGFSVIADKEYFEYLFAWKLDLKSFFFDHQSLSLLLSDVHICEHQNPCQNGAQCVYDRDGEYTCLCLEEFHGKSCEMKTGPCEKTG